MSSYDDRPWLARYDAGQPSGIEAEFGSALAMFGGCVRRDPDAPIIRYFGGVLTRRVLDEESSAFAAALAASGLQAGERVALYLQNVPQFLVVLIGTWKAGGVAVAVNPMNKERELGLILADSGATVLVCLEDLYQNVARRADRAAVRQVVTTSALEYQARDDGRVLGGVVRHRAEGTQDLATLIGQFRGRTLPDPGLGPDDVAFLTYTSGTTGPPKGAMTTHGNIVFNAQTYRDWIGITAADVILGVAPLFHITGSIGHVALSLLTGATLVLTYRFDPAVALETIRDERVTFTIGSITVFIALMNVPGADGSALATLTKIYSGGAPIPPSTVTAFEDLFGQYIHNIYGLTETTSPSHAVPLHRRAPVDPVSGALSVGVPVYDTVVRVIGEDGHDLPAGQIGELVTEGPQIVAGYWNQPEETARALPGGALRTGDVGYMDPDGWFYLVDRKKDQINVSGYKVWPREVEDVLYEHEAVREAAVVGVPDPYRGETVKAYVSLRPGFGGPLDELPGELIQHCRQRLAAYKYPRQIEVRPELPKTVTGKILRRELRDQVRPEPR
ncbi:MAG TPA: AMP-binding protein [Streptosporangiaceae bacterium]